MLRILKVIPKRNYQGAYGYTLTPDQAQTIMLESPMLRGRSVAKCGLGFRVVGFSGLGF